MAGSLNHVIEDGSVYKNQRFLDNERDRFEAIEEMAFVLLETTTAEQRSSAIEKFYACSRGEQLWPAWWNPR